jgi:fumarate hydratase class I
MPVTVAVDSDGQNAHTQGPAIWKAKIADLNEKLGA